MRKLWPKNENWSKLGTEQQVYRYTPKVYRYTLAKNDQKRKCTGTLSKCTGTSHPKCLKMCIFSPFSCTFPSQTKSILHIHFKIISNSSCNLFYTQIIFQFLSSFKTCNTPKYTLVVFDMFRAFCKHNLTVS